MNRAPQTRPALVVPPKTVATSARSSDQVRLANSRKTLDGGQGNPVPTVYVGRTYAVMYGNASSASYRVGNGEGGSDGGGGGTITTGPGRYDVFDPYYTPKIGGGG